VGHYVSLPDKWGPSVLLSRASELHPWVPFRPEASVTTARSLLSLPGYRSVVMLDGKDGMDPRVQLTLWGNVPEFCGLPPLLLESAAMLNAPDPGIDADVTLEWGRIKLANVKPSGPARVRLKFQREVWDLTLPRQDSEAAVELWSLQVPVAEARRPSLSLVAGLFTRGPVVLDRQGGRSGVPAEHLDLADHTRVTWMSGTAGPLRKFAMDGPPAWWAKPDPNAPGYERVADAAGALAEWDKRVNGTGDLVGTILKAVEESDDLSFREQGTYFLAALDRPSYLVHYLEDGLQTRVRRAAAHALRAWLGRTPGRAARLEELLQVKVNSPQKAALILQLLHPFAPDDLKRPDTYQKLIADLDDKSAAVRELASWHLEAMLPDVARKIAYNAGDAPEQRKPMVKKWQEALPPGRVPSRTQ
jgi:hypothetical protein